MEFKVINFDDEEQWNNIIGNNTDIYYKREYIYPFYINGDGIPFLAYAKDESDNIIFYVFLKNDISKFKNNINYIPENKYFDITTPYGYGGADIIGKKNSNLDKFFFTKFEEYCKENNIISEFIRFNPLNNNYNCYLDTDYEVIEISNTVYMNLNSEEQIWQEMESRCRNTIRKAEKNNIKIKTGFTETMLEEFQNIYTETMKRDNAKEYYFFNKDFFKSYYEKMKNNSFIITAYIDEKAISSSLFIYSDINANYHLSGTLTEYLKYGANNLILYEAAKKLSSIGCKKLHLGRRIWR